jgi:hypothetical protein
MTVCMCDTSVQKQPATRRESYEIGADPGPEKAENGENRSWNEGQKFNEGLGDFIASLRCKRLWADCIVER